MYFGESVEYIREQQEILEEETKRVQEFLKSEFLDDIDPKNLTDQDAKRIVGKLKQEQDKKKQAYMINAVIKIILTSVGYSAGFGLMGAGAVAAGGGVAAVSGILFIIECIVQILESKHFAKTDFGNIANRIDKKIDRLKSAGADPKLIKGFEKLYNTVSDLDTEEQLHKPSVNVSNYNYNW